MAGNTTTSVAGRVYVKDNYAYRSTPNAPMTGIRTSQVVPQLTGRAVLFTLQGMATAVHLGADLDNRNPIESLKFPPHQELQHTLTEQAVLKRMAAECLLLNFGGVFMIKRTCF